jgi:hypothetical protein
MKPIYRKISDLGLVTLFHAGLDYGFPPPYGCMPHQLERALDWFSAPVIAAHWGGIQCGEAVLRHLCGRDVYFDVSFGYGMMPKYYAERIVEQHGAQQIRCFVPHSEGRGRLLEPVRFSVADYGKLSDDMRSRINWNRFKTEAEWLHIGFPKLEKRVLTATLTPENVDFFEGLSFADTITYLEKLDEDYYAAIPTAEELANIYGNPNGDRYYSARDLQLSYQQRYIAENRLEIYDINDERKCFSRRF